MKKQISTKLKDITGKLITGVASLWGALLGVALVSPLVIPAVKLIIKWECLLWKWLTF